MYQLMRHPGPIVDRRFEIEFLEPGQSWERPLGFRPAGGGHPQIFGPVHRSA